MLLVLSQCVLGHCITISLVASVTVVPTDKVLTTENWWTDHQLKIHQTIPLTNYFCTRNILHSPSKAVAKYSLMYTFMLIERHTTSHSSVRHLLWCSAAPGQRLLCVSGWNQHFGLLGSRHWGYPTFSWARSWSHMPEYTRQKRNECKWSSSQRPTLKWTFHWERSCTELPLSSAEAKSALFFLQPWHPSLP